MAERIGCTGENIMFSSNETPAEDYRLAAKLGATINLDDVTHVDFLERRSAISRSGSAAASIRAARSRSASRVKAFRSWTIPATPSTA